MYYSCKSELKFIVVSICNLGRSLNDGEYHLKESELLVVLFLLIGRQQRVGLHLLRSEFLWVLTSCFDSGM